MAKDTKLTAPEPTALATTNIPGLEGMVTMSRPEGHDEGILGYEGIGQDDIIIPRIGVAQKMSPELEATSPRYIDGLKFADMFGSLTRKNYGRGPIYFSVLRIDPPRWVEFNPIDQGGGVRDPIVPAGDPRTKFGAYDPLLKKSVKPIATQFYDFIVLVLNELDYNDPIANIIALSLKSSAIKVAKQLNFYISQRRGKKLYKGLYELKSDSETKNSNTYAIYKVTNAGWLMPGSPVEALAGELFESWKDKAVVIDTETANDEREPGDDSFDPSAIEAEGHTLQSER